MRYSGYTMLRCYSVIPESCNVVHSLVTEIQAIELAKVRKLVHEATGPNSVNYVIMTSSRHCCMCSHMLLKCLHKNGHVHLHFSDVYITTCENVSRNSWGKKLSDCSAIFWTVHQCLTQKRSPPGSLFSKNIFHPAGVSTTRPIIEL